MLKVHVVAPSEMLKGIPEADLPKKEADFWHAVAAEYHELITNACVAQEPEIVMWPYHKAGEQYIWEFYVNDLTLPVRADAYNWHGQNIGQWRYAGAILLQKGEVSRHH
jgi:hypothetical protein